MKYISLISSLFIGSLAYVFTLGAQLAPLSVNHLARYKQDKISADQKYADFIRTTKTNDVSFANGPNYTLEELILANHYIPFAANVDSVSKAQMLVFGDDHSINTLDAIFKKLVNKGDRLLAEDSSDNIPVDLAIIGSDDTLKAKFLESIANPNVSKYLTVLIDDKKGVLDFIDASSIIKNQELKYTVVRQLFTLIRTSLLQKKELHPFEQWFLYEDLKIADKHLSAEDTINSMIVYFGSLRNDPGIRQRQIVRNVLQKSDSRNAASKDILILGLRHLAPNNNTEYDVIQSLALNGVKFIAFLPDVDAMPQPVNTTSSSGKVQNGVEYFFNVLVPAYVGIRKSESGPVYTNGYTGLLEKYSPTAK